MAERKTRQEKRDDSGRAWGRWLPWAAVAVVVGSAATLIWNGLRKVAAAAAPDVFRPDGTYGAPDPTATASGPIYPPHGRILVVGGQNAKALAYALRKVMVQIEEATPAIPATPQIVSVAAVATQGCSYVQFRELPITPENRNLGGFGAPDVIITLVGDDDAVYGPQPDLETALVSASELVGRLWPIARDHLPNLIAVIPWSGTHADALRLPLAAAIVKGAPLHALPFNPKKDDIPMLTPTEPTAEGMTALAHQLAGILLKWYDQGRT